mmetsp:Transcript_67387/g.132937  ORF Transcript_67387/g.132937 Transcript_67387/m.132937 type:complete len:523 (+) Transcript_67387:83-1651(+)
MESQQPYEQLGGGDKPEERKTVDEGTRMWLNGESPEQMAWAEAVKKAGGVTLDPKDGNDTSIDSAWTYDENSACTDRYVLITTFLWLGPKILLFALPMLICHFPPMFIARTFIALFPDSTEFVKRSASFYVIFVVALILSLPVAALVLSSLVLDYVMYYFFSILYCACTCRWSQACKSFKVIEPFRNGPSILLHLPDIFVAVLGQCARQRVGETLYMVSCMWLLMPWLKYYICCNPFIYDLEQRLCQQISTSMADVGTAGDAADTARGIISRSRQTREQAARIDIWSFVPHYPYPPKNRRWALGLQAGGSSYPGKFTLIVHSTHAVSTAGGSTEQFVLSNSVEQPVYRVMLWYSNPFHFLTGWVEASISNGMPSQPDKRMGGEHPMWLVTAHSPLVSGRDSFTGSGMIDAFFDYWLPVFVHEMRYDSQITRFRKTPIEAAIYAAEKYQEVHSDDVVSPALHKVGLGKYEGHSALDDMRKEAAEHGGDGTEKFAEEIMRMGHTEMGKKVFHFMQEGAKDLHEA